MFAKVDLCRRDCRHCRALSLVLLVGFSRIALGTHFLTDVLGAIFFGALWLICCLIAGKSIAKHHRSLRDPLSISFEVAPIALEQRPRSVRVPC